MNWSQIIYFSVYTCLLLFISCDEPVEEDRSPPSVKITSPQSGSIVNEIATIICVSTDNKGIEKVELLINGKSTNMFDYTEPYELKWNTTEYNDGYYSIIVRSYDINENMSDSEPIVLTVNNRLSVPKSISILSMEFMGGGYSIIWSKSTDYDFKSYTLEVSSMATMDNFDVIYYTTNIDDTTFFYQDPFKCQYLRITVTDTFNYQSKSSIRSSVHTFSVTYDIVGASVSIQQTNDNGFAYIGSFDDGLSGMVKLIKSDSSGNVEWNTNIGGWSWAGAMSLKYTSDHGYIVAYIDGYDMQPSVGSHLSKINSSGNRTWSNNFALSNYDYLYEVQETLDGAFVAVGSTQLNDWQGDVWVLKTNSSGDEKWGVAFGEIGRQERGSSIIQVANNGYLIAGFAFAEANNSKDVWLIKVDDAGIEEWSIMIGDESDETSNCVRATNDGGYIIFGEKKYSGGNRDILLIKTDALGNETWTKAYGGSDNESGGYGQQTYDEGYIVVGTTNSYGNGESDIWLIKTDSFGDTLWTRTFGGHGKDSGYEVQQTNDGGYIIAGSVSTYSGKQAWVIKTDCNGNSN